MRQQLPIGTPVVFSDGQTGIIGAAFNGGTLYQFHSITGAKFTVRDDELRPIGDAPAPSSPLPTGTWRTIYRMDAPTRITTHKLDAERERIWNVTGKPGPKAKGERVEADE